MMKRLKLIALVLALAMVTMIAPATATPDVNVKVDGQLLSFPDQKPYIDKANRTMVPVRTPMEAIGCKVDWDENARKATISKNGNVAEFTIGSNSYTVNSTKKTMDTQAVIVSDRTAFPIRFAAEAMGATVGWDANTYTVLINTKGVNVEKPAWNIIRRDVGRTFELKAERDPKTGLYVDRYFRFVCTSHPELNYLNTYDWNGNPIVNDNTTYTTSYELAPGGQAYNIKLTKGMVVTFDVYEKINGVEVKVDTIVETL